MIVAPQSLAVPAAAEDLALIWAATLSPTRGDAVTTGPAGR